jgi:hypothetical protein
MRMPSSPHPGQQFVAVLKAMVLASFFKLVAVSLRAALLAFRSQNATPASPMAIIAVTFFSLDRASCRALKKHGRLQADRHRM